MVQEPSTSARLADGRNQAGRNQVRSDPHSPKGSHGSRTAGIRPAGTAVNDRKGRYRSLFMDLLTIAILVFCAWYYSRKGFAMSIMGMLQWFLAISVALLCCGGLTGILKIACGAALNARFKAALAGPEAAKEVLDYVAKVFNGWVGTEGEYITETSASDITNAVLGCLAFLVILGLIRYVCSQFTKIFRRHEVTGFLGFIDLLAGLTCGIVYAFFYVLLLFVALLPLMALLPTGLTHGIYASLENSFFSGELFRNNMIVGFIHNIFI